MLIFPAFDRIKDKSAVRCRSVFLHIIRMCEIIKFWFSSVDYIHPRSLSQNIKSKYDQILIFNFRQIGDMTDIFNQILIMDCCL